MTAAVTIIIPCYNGEAFLADAVSSALVQSFPQIEVIVIDDASPDGSAAIIETFAQRDSRVRLIRHPLNRGVAEAWNTGMQASSGRYILRLAQDDILEAHAVATLVATFRESPGTDVVYGHYIHINEQGKLADPPKALADPTRLFQGENHLGLCVMIHRRVLASGITYNPRFRSAEDLDFFVRLFDAGFTFTRCPPPPLLRFRLHSEAGSSARYAEQQLEAAEILARREAHWHARAAIYGYRYNEAVYFCRKQGRQGQALLLAVAGIWHSPFSGPLWRQLLALALRRRPRTGHRPII